MRRPVGEAAGRPAERHQHVIITIISIIMMIIIISSSSIIMLIIIISSSSISKTDHTALSARQQRAPQSAARDLRSQTVLARRDFHKKGNIYD